MAKTDNTRFYQCQGEKGIIISQFPCSADAELKTVSTFVPKETRDTQQDIIQLNQTQFEQQIEVLESKIKTAQQKIRNYQRAKMTERRDELDKLEKLMDQKTKKALSKTVKQEVKNIENKYDEQVKEQRLILKDLKSELTSLKKRYQ
ncbi:hypothetical protein PTUN_a2516 [Pseudoalteromonas tunicata]|jgi:uncharacterized circularly permuted ATP-grasp superfamily protein|uniref:Uncharacterized protein n=2 Tax=Pseudoalteromonas tunicata TaxID=314281 RepID=A4CAN0_9GAMM|nr:hypothetical protein PTUN_a2516 [Pseudoalteromonas tunicata]EAR28438.1 hypothetical protein PTD2_21522 [Pseudoalteromonas tunicata D2]